MIDNINTNNFYSKNEMIDRGNYIPTLKQHLLNKLKDLTNKIELEEPFPEGNMDLDFLCDTHDKIEFILGNWYH